MNPLIREISPHLLYPYRPFPAPRSPGKIEPDYPAQDIDLDGIKTVGNVIKEQCGQIFLVGNCVDQPQYPFPCLYLVLQQCQFFQGIKDQTRIVRLTKIQGYEILKISVVPEFRGFHDIDQIQAEEFNS